MKKVKLSWLVVVAVGVCFSASVAFAQTTITGCVNTKTGALRIVSLEDFQPGGKGKDLCSKRKTQVSLLLASHSDLSALGRLVGFHASILQSTGESVAEWSTAKGYTGAVSAHLKTDSNIGQGKEASIIIEMPPGTTLADLTSMEWMEYLVADYPPHLDIKLDLGGPFVFSGLPQKASGQRKLL